MASITETLTNEHTQFCVLFNEIERLLPDVRTVAEVRLLSRLVEGVLSHHADVEENLAYAALDHALAENGEPVRMYQDHHEIDWCLQHARQAKGLPTALRLLKAGLKTSRAHFRREEETIFPLLEKLFDSANLEALGARVPTQNLVSGTTRLRQCLARLIPKQSTASGGDQKTTAR